MKEEAAVRPLACVKYGKKKRVGGSEGLSF